MRKSPCFHLALCSAAALLLLLWLRCGGLRHAWPPPVRDGTTSEEKDTTSSHLELR